MFQALNFEKEWTKNILSFFQRTKNITLSKVKGQKTHFFKAKDQKHTFSKIEGPKTHFSKLRDQNMTLCKLKGPKTYFSLLKYVQIYVSILIHYLIQFKKQNLKRKALECYMQGVHIYSIIISIFLYKIFSFILVRSKVGKQLIK